VAAAVIDPAVVVSYLSAAVVTVGFRANTLSPNGYQEAGQIRSFYGKKRGFWIEKSAVISKAEFGREASPTPLKSGFLS
jgi:hypothetical protein